MKKKSLSIHSLVGVGIGGIIGAGFFLGSGLAVHEAGPSIILAYILGGLIMSQVLGSITSIHVNRLQRGSFRVYSEQFLGPFIGDLIGWMVLCSGILTIGSEALAMGIFVNYWLPSIPLPILSTFFTVVVIGLNAFGIGAFGKIESFMAGVKFITLVLFVLLGVYWLLLNGIRVIPNPFSNLQTFFPNGFSGFLQSMLIVIFSFAGISALLLASSEAEDPRKIIPKATFYTTIGTILIYTLAIAVLVSMVSWHDIYINKSPFVEVLDTMHIYWLSSVLNIVILLAAFSVMGATYFTATQMLVSLSTAAKAPAFFSRAKNGLNLNAWLFVGIFSILLVAASFFVSHRLFNYLIAASSYFTFLHWILNLLTFLSWLKHRKKDETYVSPLIWGRWGAYLTMAAIIVLVIVSLRVTDFRMGFYASLAILLLISTAYLIRGRKKLP